MNLLFAFLDPDEALRHGGGGECIVHRDGYPVGRVAVENQRQLGLEGQVTTLMFRHPNPIHPLNIQIIFQLN